MTELAASDLGPPVRRELLDDGVLLLTLNRPGHRNAWNADMETTYFDLLEQSSYDPQVRAVVVTGAGETFCPGMDMAVLERASGGGPRYSVGGTRRPQTFALQVPKPVIAAINGACAGVGFVQALMCDVRIAVPTAKLTSAFSRRGLAAEDGVSWMLPRLVGWGRAADLLLSGRVFTGEDAHAYGLVQELATAEALVARAVDYAAMIARNCSPYAMAVIKQQLVRDVDGALEQARRRSLGAIELTRSKPDYREGVASFLERRPPRFQGYDGGPLPEGVPAQDDVAAP